MSRLGCAKREKGAVTGAAACGRYVDSVRNFEFGAVEDKNGVGAQIGRNEKLASRVEENLVRVCSRIRQ